MENETKEKIVEVKTNEAVRKWIPRTALGRKVMNGEISDINEIFKRGFIIKEAEIVDFLITNLQEKIILVGGTPGKGGGIKRSPIRSTARMHKSGRKRSIHTLVIVGNGNGYVGIGYAKSRDVRDAINKSTRKAKLNLISIKRGCGSWECNCTGHHSIPFKTEARKGAVTVTLLPAPKGISLCVADEVKKVMRAAGIKDIWVKSKGKTKTRLNFILAIFEALKKMNDIKVDDSTRKKIGIVEGAVNE